VHRRGGWLAYGLAGGSLLLFSVFLAVLSRRLATDQITREHALVWLASGGVVAGMLYLVGLYRARKCGFALAPAWIMAIALMARLIVCISPPMLESDYQRYLWDGAVTARGINPYRHAPADILNETVRGPDAEGLADLASRAGPVLQSINHPKLTTIYPPVAQASFAAAYAIAPFNPNGLRIVFCLAEAGSVLLLGRLLKALALPASQIAWLAWNPLLLREVYSSLHMDVLLLPLIAGALLAAIRSRAGVSAAFLVIASAVKVWPLVLAPLVLRPLVGQWRRAFLAVAGLGVLVLLLWLPVFLAPHGENSGFLAYGRGWQNNDGFFRAGIWVTERVLTLLRIEPWHSHTIMRIVSTSALAGLLLWCLRAPARTPDLLLTRALIIVGTMFLLSPTQFPWYWVWCLPLLTLRPSLPLLAYSALLPIYYVQDQLVYPLSHWLQHAPVWALLTFSTIRSACARRCQPCASPEVSRA
jgi:hypothetical protein